MLLPLPEGRVDWSDPRLKQAWVVLVLGAAVALLLFPRTVSISDESYYAGQAQALLHGHLIPTAADALPLEPGNAAEAVRYPWGWPLLLAPFRLLGFRAMFAAALLIHLAGGAAVARMLVRRGLPAWLVAFYVFHPVAWVFSRSLMSDVPAVALVLLSMDYWEQGAPGRSSLALGYAMFSRMATLMPAAGMGLAVLSGRRPSRGAMILALGALAGGVALAALNWWTAGNPLGLWYSRAGVPALTGDRIPQHAMLYGLGLLLLPPFPLACLLLRPGRCDRWALAAIPTLAFFVAYSYHDASQSRLETFLGGQRLILGAHAVLLVATMRVWAAIPLLRFRKVVMGAALTGAACASLAWRRVLEERFVPAVQAVRACRPASLSFNDLAMRVATAVEAREYRLITDGTAPPATDVAVVATSVISLNPAGTGSFQVPPSWNGSARCRQAGVFMVFDFAGRCPRAGPPCTLAAPVPATASRAERQEAPEPDS